MSSSDCYVYILLCTNGAYYTGYTTDLARRLNEHFKGTKKCKFTRSFKPLQLACCWRIPGGKSDAMRVERHIKKLDKHEKKSLAASPELLLQRLQSLNPILERPENIPIRPF